MSFSVCVVLKSSTRKCELFGSRIVGEVKMHRDVEKLDLFSLRNIDLDASLCNNDLSFEWKGCFFSNRLKNSFRSGAFCGVG